jgi:[acyl-carrier-protein] S-malonyltransferase
VKAFIFPGQGIQKAEMGKDLYNFFPFAKQILENADDILGRSLSSVMISGDEIELTRSYNAQPAIFLYEFILATMQDDIKPDLVAGHSFGEFAALVVNNSIKFEDALRLVMTRAELGENFVNNHETAMAAVIGLDDEIIEHTVSEISKNLDNSVFIANYNGPGQLVLSGSETGIKEACRVLKLVGAKRAIVLPIKGAFHTPLMNHVAISYKIHIENVDFYLPHIPICQCADSSINIDEKIIKRNLINHMTSSVNWTKMVKQMVDFGITEFIEIGTDDTLQKIVKRMYPELKVTSILDIQQYKDKIRNYSIY